MSAPARHPCPICGREVSPPGADASKRSFPFCSPACKLVDLGRWLDGSYRVPGPLSIDDDEGRHVPTGDDE